MDELVREALQEGRLTVAGGGPAALYTPWAAGFEKRLVVHRPVAGQQPAVRQWPPRRGPGPRRRTISLKDCA
jgi:hypothetical protein